jgi:hypothetical protein
MSPSAISTPVFAAQNSNILNDGSADSPRGFGSVTTAGTFNITATGPSLYRVVVATPAAPITAALPTTVKAGYRCRIEVELTGSTETNCFFTSPAIAEAQINGTGFVELMAKVDNPSVAGDWKVTDVAERATLTCVGSGVWASNQNISITFSRLVNTVTARVPSVVSVASGSPSNAISIALPARFGGSAIRFNAINGNDGASYNPSAKFTVDVGSSTMVISKTNAELVLTNFTASLNCGWAAFVFTYPK